MSSEQQQPPVPPQAQPGQAGYLGWQYDQEPEAPPQQPARPIPPVPSQFSPSTYPPRATGGRLSLPSQPLPAIHPAQPPQAGSTPQPPYSPQAPVPPPVVQQSPLLPAQQQGLPRSYQEPIADMGTSLGYGQGMAYQYFDAPQPSQPMPKLRQQRLQQLRQERMQRERQQKRPDLTSSIPWRRSSNRNAPLNSLQSAQVLPPGAHSGPLNPGVAPSRSRPLSQPLAASSGKQKAVPAAEPAQDTGMIQRIRVGNASLILAGAFIASRVLGLLRSSIFAAIFGTGVISDSYVQAFLIPDTIFTIVAGGALSSAFIPVFTKHMTDGDEKGAWHIANTALTLSIALMVVIGLIAMIFAQPLVMLYNPMAAHQTLQDYHFKINLITLLLRIMLLQPIILGFDVIITSVLNAQQNFLIPAIGSVLYNVGLLIGLLPGVFLSLLGQNDPTRNPGNQQFSIYCAAAGVVLGALIMVIFELPGLRKVGLRFVASFDWRLPDVRQIAKQMLPRVFNSAAFSLTTFVDRYMIGLLGVVVVVTKATKGLDPTAGLQTQYYQAYTLIMLPLGIIGQAMSTAAFPTLAEYVSKGRMDRVRQIILETLRSILFLSFPSSLGLIVLSLPIIQVLFEHGAFSLSDATSTAIPLCFFAVGLVGLSVVEILTRAFYAMRDSKTPVTVSIAQFVLKIALSLILIDPFALLGGPSWGMAGLAFATSLASLAEGTVLFILLNQRIGGLFDRDLGKFIVRVLIATAAMALCVLLFRAILDALLNTTNPSGAHYIKSLPVLPSLIANVFKLALELLVGAFVFLRAARMLHIEELGPVYRLLDRFKLSWMI